MRTHTALHVLCGVVWRDWAAQVTGGNMEPGAGRMDFEFERMSGELVGEIEARVNVELAAERDVRVKILPRDEAFAIPDLIRTKINLLPPGIAEVRTVEIVGLDLQADGGTHVANTREVGPIRVDRLRVEGPDQQAHPASSSRVDAMTEGEPGGSTTPALEAINALGVEHRVVRTGMANSAEESAEMQGIPLGALLRTIVVRRGEDDYLFVLVPAGRRFDWPKLRAHLGVTRLSLPDADEAQRVTGYVRYTITPVRLHPSLAGHRRRLAHRPAGGRDRWWREGREPAPHAG